MTTHAHAVAALRAFPTALAALVAPIAPADRVARPIPGEWSIAQNVHHLADSHMHSYLRCRRIATEEFPMLSPYDQDRWAETPDATAADWEGSLTLLHGLHTRWATFFDGLSDAQWHRTGFHPEVGEMSLEFILDLYVTHGAGHLDQITRTIAALR
ncbi:MAG: hypothetical protein RLZZ297_132 [Chloroflexota bacterium]|jgi:DinB superfamily